MRSFLFSGATLDWSDLVRALPAKEFAKPTRSTLPLLAWWRDQDPSSIIDVDGAVLEVEAQVASSCVIGDDGPTNRRNQASFTDLMVRNADAAAAFEGKWTEPQYDTVADWLAKRPGPNREGVIEHWLDLLAPYCGTIDRDLLGQCTYQMLHRAASACAQGRERAILVYQVFAHGTDEYVRRLDILRRTLAPDRLELTVMPVPMRTTEAWARLRSASSERIRRALLEHALFDFS